MRIPILIGVSALMLGSAGAAEKQYGPGVSDTEIKIGQTIPYSGPASAFSSYGRVMTGYFQMLNESGGIRPRRGCCQRTSASTSQRRPVARSTIGW